MNTNRNNLTLATCLCVMMLACACTSLYRGVVTLTDVVDSAAKEYASAFNRGLVPPDTAAKVATIYLGYRKAAGVARDALIAYKVSGDAKDFDTALAAAKVAALNFVDAIVPFIVHEKATTLKSQIQTSTKP